MFLLCAQCHTLHNPPISVIHSTFLGLTKYERKPLFTVFNVNYWLGYGAGQFKRKIQITMRDAEFWHNKWASNQIGFHLEDVNPLLTRFWSALAPKREETVLVPLCGKTEDLAWLATKHDHVEGAELSLIAVRSFFAEHFYTPTVIPISGQHELYQFDELAIYAGDFFTAPLSKADLIYDRAALIALPEEMRVEYVQRIRGLLNPGGRILLVSLDYPQQEMSGPPFSVAQKEIEHLFAGMRVTRLHQDIANEHHPKIAKQGLSRFSEEVYVIESNK
ncbi:Thiopurine S-methyltransferase [Vibrio vulnificus]|nr:Thiopurine S-methyltransferase [Vibrio vulnificus]